MDAVNAEKIEERMTSAQKMAQGTVSMWVVFDTKDEVSHALNWMKGKIKVKNLTPLTHEQATKKKDNKRKEMARALGIKE